MPMIDFLFIARRTGKHGVIEIYPKLIIKHSKDLMIRGGDFYAIWLEERGLWSTDEQDALQLIDRELDNYAEEHKVLAYHFITEEEITITNIVYHASMLKARNPSVETVYAIDNYPGLRNDCKASMYRSTIENCAIFKNILEIQGVQIY